MTRRLLLTLTLAATAACAPVAAADAAKPAPYPTVSKVEPLALGIGDTLKLTGRNFTAGKNKNTVVFKRDGKKAVFAKAQTATKTTLSVVVPEKLLGALGKKDGAEVPTKFRVRVLSAKRFGKGYTALKTSPTIAPKGKAILAEETRKATAEALQTLAAATPQAPAGTPPAPDCDGDGVSDANDPQDDNDGLTDALEAQLKTDRCRVDTDGDGMEDGWEYKSAFDLNRDSCDYLGKPYPTVCAAATPAKYPAKKPYPNPLDPADGATDHDGDWLSASEEHQAWKLHVGNARDLTVPLWYSDGLQASIDDGHSSTCRGMVVPPVLGNAALYGGPAYAVYSLDTFGRTALDGCLNDSERDEDNDFLGNVTETSAELSNADWYKDVYDGEIPYRIKYEGTNWLDQDSDGDGVVDGKDDQDHDDFWNLEETVRTRIWPASADPAKEYANALWMNAFNPCLPAVESRTCPATIQSTGDVWAPFYRPPATEPEGVIYPLYKQPRPFVSWGVTLDLWKGVGVTQKLPPPHPLPRCWEDVAPGC